MRLIPLEEMQRLGGQESVALEHGSDSNSNSEDLDDSIDGESDGNGDGDEDTGSTSNGGEWEEGEDEVVSGKAEGMDGCVPSAHGGIDGRGGSNACAEKRWDDSIQGEGVGHLSSPNGASEPVVAGSACARVASGATLAAKKRRKPSLASLHHEWARIVREPRRRGQHVILDVCAAVGSVEGGGVGRGEGARSSVLPHDSEAGISRHVVAIDELDNGGRQSMNGAQVETVDNASVGFMKKQGKRKGELQRVVVSKAAGVVEYRFARRVKWGDLWPL